MNPFSGGGRLNRAHATPAPISAYRPSHPADGGRLGMPQPLGAVRYARAAVARSRDPAFGAGNSLQQIHAAAEF
jgi:hypothetical protein